MQTIPLAMIFGALAAGLAGCVVEPARVRVAVPAVVVGEVVVSRRPPAPLVEVIPPPPPGPVEIFAWQPGHWHWDGRDYRWQRGHYERRPSRQAVWVAHAWVARGNQWVFKPGHWENR